MGVRRGEESEWRRLQQLRTPEIACRSQSFHCLCVRLHFRLSFILKSTLQPVTMTSVRSIWSGAMTSIGGLLGQVTGSSTQGQSSQQFVIPETSSSDDADESDGESGGHAARRPRFRFTTEQSPLTFSSSEDYVASSHFFYQIAVKVTRLHEGAVIKNTEFQSRNSSSMTHYPFHWPFTGLFKYQSSRPLLDDRAPLTHDAIVVTHLTACCTSYPPPRPRLNLGLASTSPRRLAIRCDL